MAIPHNAANIAPATAAVAERIRAVFDRLEGAIGNVHHYMDLTLAVQNQLQEPQIQAQSPTRKVKESGELFLEVSV